MRKILNILKTLDLTHLTQENDMTPQENEYRPQLTADLELLYASLDDHDKGVLQDRLDDMWIMYCITRYTDKGTIAPAGCTVDSNEG